MNSLYLLGFYELFCVHALEVIRIVRFVVVEIVPEIKMTECRSTHQSIDENFFTFKCDLILRVKIFIYCVRRNNFLRHKFKRNTK